MSQRTDAEFESIIHDDHPAAATAAESDDAKQLRAELVAPHAGLEDSSEG